MSSIFQCIVDIVVCENSYVRELLRKNDNSISKNTLNKFGNSVISCCTYPLGKSAYRS